MWRALFVIVSFNVTQAFAADLYSSCLHYGANRLVGTLVRQTYAGPPDYESVTKGDEARIIWILQLDAPVCVDSNGRHPRELRQQEIELALSADQYGQYQTLLGHKIIASGELIHGGANYQKRLVLTASDLQKTPLIP